MFFPSLSSQQAGDFSNYQLNKLLNKGKMTQRLDELRKEMTARNTGAVASMLDFDSAQELLAGRIMSEDMEHYVLVKNKSQDQNGDKDGASTSDSQQIATIEKLEEKSQGISDKSATEVKGQSVGNVKVKNDTPSDLTELEEVPVSSNKSKEITEAVKSFFAKNKMDSKQSANIQVQGQRSWNKGQMGLGSKDSDVVVISDNDVSVSPGEVEVVEMKDGQKTKNMQSLFTSAIDKFVHSALTNKEDTRTNSKEKDTQDKAESSGEDDIMIVGEVGASPSVSQREKSSQRLRPGEKRTSMAPFMSTLLDKLVASALSEDNETEDKDKGKDKVVEEVDSSDDSDGEL